MAVDNTSPGSASSAPLSSSINPLCLDRLLSLDSKMSPGKIDLDDCQERFAEYSFSQNTPWQATYEKNNQVKTKNFEELPDYAQYEIIGQMQNSQVLLSYSANYGGSGTFNHAYLVQGLSLDNNHDSELTQTLAIEGGDRCFGSIEKLDIIAPGTFEIRRRTTASALIGYGLSAEKAAKVTKGLSDCALCCIGNYTERATLKGKRELTSVTLFPKQSRSSDSAKDRCLNQLTMADSHTVLMTKENLKELQEKFIRECAK
ncbi:hypothetical protein EOPP23_01335 [Endozoicomonas sp. OPT23]|nr:hypothetical protein [Endozoicomonas sp. OPT23]